MRALEDEVAAGEAAADEAAAAEPVWHDAAEPPPEPPAGLAALPVEQSPAAAFRVRGARYLHDRVKRPPAGSDMELVRLDLAWAEPPPPQPLEGHRHVRFQFSCPRGLVFTLEFAAAGPTGNPLLERFVDTADDAWRAARLKIAPQCVEGPLLLQWTLGKPAILARAITTTFERGPGWVVARHDICNSTVGSRLFGRVTRALKTCTIDLGFIIEGQTDDELPERLVGGARMARVDFAAAVAAAR